MRALEGRVARIERKLSQRRQSDAWIDHLRELNAIDEAYPLMSKSEPQEEPPPAAAAMSTKSEPPDRPAAPQAPPHDTHEIPEHRQIRPVRWRLRGPEDYADDEGRFTPRTPQDEEYDPLADEE